MVVAVAAAAEGDRHRRRHHGRECPKPDTSYIPRQHVMMCGNVIPRPMDAACLTCLDSLTSREHHPPI